VCLDVFGLHMMLIYIRIQFVDSWFYYDAVTGLHDIDEYIQSQLLLAVSLTYVFSYLCYSVNLVDEVSAIFIYLDFCITVGNF